MHRTRPVEDPARRWRRFCRVGWGLAFLAVLLWAGTLALALRVAPLPLPLPREPAPQVSWWPGPDPAGEKMPIGMDVRTLWSPAVFALPSPAGFSHGLRRGRARLAPPVHTARPDAAFLAAVPPAVVPEDPFTGGPVGPVRRMDLRRMAPETGVFPPRVPERETARMEFSAGWESRLFSGIDLGYRTWTSREWTARIDMRFDNAGVPASMLLVQSSGRPDVDRRLARSAHGWRLLDAAAPRAGTVSWRNPGPEAVTARTSPGGAP